MALTDKGNILLISKLGRIINWEEIKESRREENHHFAYQITNSSKKSLMDETII